MPEETPTYDLMLLLSMSVDEERRAAILAEVKRAIAAGGGSVTHNGAWGARALAYPIAHQNTADYHLMQFTGPPALIESLKHSLAITDGVLRFRIIKALPGTPAPPTPEPSHAATAGPTGGGSEAPAPQQPAEHPASGAGGTP